MSLILDNSTNEIRVKNGGAVKIGGLVLPEALGTEGQMLTVSNGVLVFANGFDGSYNSLTDKPTIPAAPTYLAPRTKTVTGTVLDWSDADVIYVTLTGNVTFTMTGAVDGQTCLLVVKQDGTGSHTVVWPSSVRYGTDLTSIVLTTTANKADRIGFIYNATDASFDLVATAKGY